MVGVSCHSLQDVQRAESEHATFAVFAPVFEKKGLPSAGLETLTQVCREKIPVLALGGVTVENAVSCLYAGASGIAGIRLFQDHDICETVSQLRKIP
jgi:thiamine-phosphate pyrophosphorylase